jgi:hypothetical protein
MKGRVPFLAGILLNLQKIRQLHHCIFHDGTMSCLSQK